MARAAVKAKQQEKAKAQPAKARARGRRRHSGGGNPNQELFFVRLRRHQRWVYALLAVVFGLSFVLVGVGSGSGGGGLSDLWTGLFGGSGGSSISKASDEVKTNPAKGYRDLATAYEQAGQPAKAVIALQQYLALKKNDATAWGELGGLQMSQANTYATQYQNAQGAAQAADPSAPFLPGGTLGSAIGQNPTYADASQAAAAKTSALYQKATSASSSAVTSYQTAVKIHPRNATYLQLLATAAQNAGNSKVTLNALRRYLEIYPNSPLKSQYEKAIKALEAQVKASSAGGTPTVRSGSGH
jgi:tetratricopeptide (TPR) repeat protein